MVVNSADSSNTSLQYSCLENPMDGGAWWAAVLGVAKSQTQLSDFTFTFHFHALEKEMATHSGVLAWRIPGTGKPGGLLSMGSCRVEHDWSDLAAAAAAPSFWRWDMTVLPGPLLLGRASFKPVCWVILVTSVKLSGDISLWQGGTSAWVSE